MQKRTVLGSGVHLVFPVLALIVVPVSCQIDCPLFNESNLGNTDAPSTTGLVGGAFRAVSGDPSPVNVQVHTSRIVCLASGRTRDTYRRVSVVVNYTCTGAPSECNRNPILSQFEFECVAGPRWTASVGGSAANIITTPPNGTLSTTLRTDCGVCISPARSGFDAITNNEQHCGSCDSACNFGLKKCFSRLDNGCCSVYENNICRGNCTSPLVANSSFICVTDCGSLNITNGVVNYQPQGRDQTLTGATASYTCNSGYTLSENIVRTCQASGVWTDNDPFCNPIDCGTLHAPLNGQLNITSSTFGSVAVYSCTPPYMLSGTMARTCQSTGEWSGSQPVCTIDCGTLRAPLNGQLNITSSTFGSVAVYSCMPPYVLSGTMARTCQSTGEWSGSEPVCTIDCGTLRAPLNGQLNITSSTFGSVAVYSCMPPYVLSGTMARTCQSTGEWSGSEPVCTIDCGTLRAPLNGQLNITSSTFGSVAVYSCMPPYVLSGTMARTCQSTGEWSGSEPVCSCSLFCRNGGTPDTSCTACHCTPGLTGTLCDVDIDECDVINPCSGGSSCINELGGYRCECVPGFTGQNCAEDINECLSYPCLNGGTCTNEIGGFNCSCINGYFGETCGDISPCFRNCSEACLQAQWQRDLCVFYNELRDWRSTAVQCGLQVPIMEPSDQGTAEQQWSEARAYWNTLRSLWAIQAQNRDVIDPALTQPTPVSSVLDVLWQDEATNWEAEFRAWQQYAVSQRLPVAFATSPAVIQSNWIVFLNEWSSSYDLYNDTYSQVCRTG